MLNSLKIYFYFYIVTLPFTLFITKITSSSSDLDLVLLVLIINVFVGLSAFTYCKKIKPLFNEEKAKSKVNLLLIISLVLLFFYISSELTTIYDNISEIEQTVSDMKNDISEIIIELEKLEYLLIYS